MKITKTAKKYTPYRVDLAASVTGTRRVRKFFATMEEASAYVARLKREGFERADTRAGANAIAVVDLAEMWLASKSTLEGASRKQIEMLVRRIRETPFGRMDSAGVTHREAGAWLDAQAGGPVHKRNLHRLAKRMFQWAVDWQEIIDRNPMRKVPVPAGDRQPVQILTPREFRLLLAGAASRPDSGPLLAFLGLGGLAGLRTCEIERADWKDIGTTEIHVAQPKRTKRGLRPRFVEILPALSVILDKCRKPEGAALPWNPKNFRLHRSAFVQSIAGFGQHWPDNCLRHSFRTYHVAHFQSIDRTRIQMGHGTADMTAYQYGGVDRREVAAEWFDEKLVSEALKNT